MKKNSTRLQSIEDVRKQRLQLKYELEVAKLKFKQSKKNTQKELDPEQLYADLLGSTVLLVQRKLSSGVWSKLFGWLNTKR